MSPKALIAGDIACTLILAAAVLVLGHAILVAWLSGAFARAVR